MDQIKIVKKNHAFMYIETDPSIEMELTEHFCFFVPGYKFMPAYRNKYWDGKIRLFDSRKKTLYIGLYKYLKQFALEREYECISTTSKRYGSLEPEKDLNYIPKEWLDNLNLTSNQLSLTSKCGPVDLPVEPTVPMISPCFTF